MKRKDKAARAAAVTVAATGIVTGTLFDTPSELLPDLTQDATVEEILDDGDDGSAISQNEKKRSGVQQRMRTWVLSLPAAVRMLVVLPLWAVGWVIMSGVSALVGTVAAPMARIISWLCLSLILLAVFGFSVKAAFPKLPVRKILRPRNLLFLSGVALLLGLADLAVPTVWTGYNAATQIVWRIGATCLLAVACGGALVHYGKQYKEEIPQLEAPRELTQEEIQETARRLADTVTPGKF